MKFTIDKHERYVVIEPLSPFLNGEIANKLKAEFMMRNTSGQRNIVLDLSNVEDADENGIRMGILANRLCEAHGGLFILTGICERVFKLIEVSNLQRFFTIVDSIEKAEDLIFGNEIRLDLRGK